MPPTSTSIFTIKERQELTTSVFIPPSYPDNLEDTPSLVKKPEKDMGHWEEIHATSSETSVRSSPPTLRRQGKVKVGYENRLRHNQQVKADRGDINIQQQRTTTRDLDKDLGEEEPPKLDEM